MDAPDFILCQKDGHGRVKGSLLAKHVRKHLQYKFVRNNGRGDQQIYVYRDGVYKPCSQELFKGYIKQFIAEYDENLIAMPSVNEAYNQLNGILTITDDGFTLLPHSPEVLSTIQIPCDWAEKEVPTPVFDEYLNTLTKGNRQVANLLLEYMGVVISNVKGYHMKKSLFMVGPGDTGKSQLKSLCEKLIGYENYSGCDFSDLEERFGSSDLYCKRLVGSADASFLKVKELRTFKKLTGGDTIRAEFKRLKAFNFTYNGLLWLCMNSLPKFGGDNGPWVYERIMVVVCDNVIPKDKQDKTLLDKMYAEREGIIQKAVSALRQVIQNGYRFDEPQCVTEMRQTYMNENNTIVSFFEECLCPRPQGRIYDDCSTGRVYKVYKAWCRNNNHGYAETERDFRKEISALMGGEFKDVTTRRNGSTFYKDYTLTLEAKQDYAALYGYDNINT